MSVRRTACAAASALAAAVLLSCAAGDAAGVQDYERRYEDIAADLASSVQDETALEALQDRADSLSDEIRRHRLDNRDQLDDEESDRLRALESEVGDFADVVRVVGQLSNSADVEITEFDTVNRRLKLEPEVMQTLDSDLELVRIEIGSFTSILLRNPTPATLIVDYEVNDPDRPVGTGNAACESYSVMSGLFNSRDRDLEGLQIQLQSAPTGFGDCG
jgi:hypothetical protein